MWRAAYLTKPENLTKNWASIALSRPMVTVTRRRWPRWPSSTAPIAAQLTLSRKESASDSRELSAISGDTVQFQFR